MSPGKLARQVRPLSEDSIMEIAAPSAIGLLKVREKLPNFFR